MGWHESSVQSLPSSQLIGVPPQIPLLQVSAVVQALPSLHGSVLGSCRQPADGSQESVVQGLPSLQLKDVPLHVPLPHVSDVVQALPSSHGALLFAWTHPLAESHESVVQGLPSSQIGGAPPVQLPPLHVSPVVQALPSLHGALLFVWTHPIVAGSQESFVQGLPSSQFGGAPPAQIPPLHVSNVVHSLWSSHGMLLFVWTHPVAGSQESIVQTLVSSQSGGVPAVQVPPLQKSPVVQAFPSSHDVPVGRGVNVQPVSGLQESAVHEFPSSQTLGLPRQFPPLHASSSVHEVAVAAGTRVVGANAGTGRGIAVVDRAGVPVVAVDRRGPAHAGGRIAHVLRARIAVVARSHDAPAHDRPRFRRHAGVVGRAEAAVVARRAWRGHVPRDALPRIVTGIRPRAGVPVVARGPLRLDLPDAGPGVIADIADGADQPVVARRSGRLRLMDAASPRSGMRRVERARIHGTGVAIVAVERVVPARPAGDIARIDGARVEVVARGALEGGERPSVARRYTRTSGGGHEDQRPDRDDRQEHSAKVRLMPHALFLQIPSPRIRRAKTLPESEGCPVQCVR